MRLKEWDIIDRPASDLFSGNNAWILDSVKAVRRSGKTDLSMDTDVVLQDGNIVSVNLAVVPLIDIKNESIGFMFVFEDISSEKRVKGTMARYMSRDLVEQLLKEGSDVLVGSLQEVTVLFSDIREFTSVSEQIGARETVAMLNNYFSEMVDVVFAYGGILDKYIGDAMMAIFGTPFKKPEDPDNAVCVANEMIVTLRAHNEKRRQAGHHPIDIGIGINTGEVVAGNIGSPKRMEYTVIGDGVNLASRMEGATKYYGSKILISEFTREKLKQTPLLRQLDLIRVKGKDQPVAVFEVLDFHTEESFPNLAKILRLFDQGSCHYHSQDWSAAIRSFEGALNLNPKDRPSELFRNRCLHYQLNSPGDDWDGVWTLTEK